MRTLRFGAEGGEDGAFVVFESSVTVEVKRCGERIGALRVNLSYPHNMNTRRPVFTSRMWPWKEATRRIVIMTLLVAALAGCYRVRISTGLAPSGHTVHEEWAHAYLLGLIPPKPRSVAARCPYGVSHVETQQSFYNWVAQWLTWGIYSPMRIHIACAAATDSATTRLMARPTRPMTVEQRDSAEISDSLARVP